MNILMGDARLSLDELKLGLEGALNISDAMEALSTSLSMNRVPANWAKVRPPPKKKRSQIPFPKEPYDHNTITSTCPRWRMPR